jgi:hypothetical protein
LWQPIPGEFDDYITMPKGNNYQSLHTAVVGPEGKVVEVQIRTYQMNEHAELGVASHWRYKEGGPNDPAFDNKIAIMRQLLDAGDEKLDDESLLESFQTAASEDRVYVLTPAGKVIDLAEPLLVADKKAARIHLLERLLLALLTGNGDLHLENLSLIGAAGEAHFSPVYDPTPMRAYSMHNMVCAVTFGEYGEHPDEDDPLQAACIQFTQNIGLRRADLGRCVERLLEVTADYAERVEALDALPGENRERLVGIHRNVQQRLRGLITD